MHLHIVAFSIKRQLLCVCNFGTSHFFLRALLEEKKWAAGHELIKKN